jgi:hypothetical protein
VVEHRGGLFTMSPDDRPSPGAFSPGRFGGLTDAALTEKGIWQYAHYYHPAPA